MEMSFVDSEDVIGMIDGMMKMLAKDILDIDLQLPLPRLTYAEAMTRFGHDAPDMRFGAEIVDLTDIAKKVDFRVFRAVADSGNHVRAICAPGGAAVYTRRKIDDLTSTVQQDFGAKGLAWFRVEEDGTLFSTIAKNFLIMVIADTWEVSCKALYGLRKRIGVDLKLYDPNEMHFSWVVEFPMFDHDKDADRWNAMHHPFTAPLEEDLASLDSDPGKARAQAYDLIINGHEAGGGTIRIHDSSIQAKVFGLLGLSEKDAVERFGFLLDALKYGAPPHGGIALGIDRVVMLFGKLDNIRDCIAFPKTQKAFDMMTEAPNVVDKDQLEELAIETTVDDLDDEEQSS